AQTGRNSRPVTRRGEDCSGEHTERGPKEADQKTVPGVDQDLEWRYQGRREYHQAARATEKACGKAGQGGVRGQDQGAGKRNQASREESRRKAKAVNVARADHFLLVRRFSCSGALRREDVHSR